jgi:hypothetical protein
MNEQTPPNYSQQEVQGLLDNINILHEKELMNKSKSPSSSLSTLNNYQQNIVEWQLDLSREFDLIYHQLRGHVIKRDKDGNEYWGEPTMKKLIKIVRDQKGTKYYIEQDLKIIIKIKNKDGSFYDLDYSNGRYLYQRLIEEDLTLIKIKPLEVIDHEQKLLNEKGAQEVEKIIRNYLNKNLLLSNFTLEEINFRLNQFSHRLRRFIYINYEEFGLDSYYKEKHFEMIVMNIVDVVEASYHRALNGEERQSLTTIRQIIQSETFDSSGGMQQRMPQFKPAGSKLNPLSWFK